MNADKHRYKKSQAVTKLPSNIMCLSVFICVHLWLILLSSCATKPTDMRTLVPADSLVYLETNDLAAALQPIVDSKPFNEVAKSKPDFSALKGVQLAVAVTGFETSEEKVNEGQFIGRIQPRFVAVADTHAWNFQAVAFAERKLGSFAENIYDSEPTLDKSDKNGGKYFTWTAPDGRKAYALVIDSLIYFGNDPTAIDKCLAVKRGEADSIAKTGKGPSADPKTLASGYVSTDGVAQIANIIGLKFASETSEDSEVQSAIAGILPQLIRNSITEVTWTANKIDEGIEDNYSIKMPPDIANVFNETMAPAASPDSAPFDVVVPGNLPSVTFYNLKDPQVAWRSLLLTAQKEVDPLGGRMIVEFSSLVFEPYGIRDPELFLSSVNSPIITANYDAEGEKPFAMVWIKDDEKVKRAIVPELKPVGDGMTQHGVQFARSDADDLESAFVSDRLVIGSIEAVGSCFTGNGRWPSVFFEKERLGKMIGSKAAIVTTGMNLSLAPQIVNMLSQKKSDEAKAESTYFTETRFTKTSIERRAVSDFGLIGSIIAQLGDN